MPRWTKLLLPACCLTIGCMGLTGSKTPPPAAPPIAGRTPTATELVAYLNRTTSQVESLECSDVALDCKAGNQEGGLSATLYCQKPRYFRLRGKALGKPVADFGSNQQEFWYWISQDNPAYVYHCDYSSLSQGNVPLPFPFHPDFVLETLGMGTYSGAMENYRVNVPEAGKLELVENSTSLQGQAVQKVTMFNAGNAGGATPQVTGHKLLDSTGRLICQATVTSVKRDAKTGSTVPHVLKLEWPAQKMEMKMKLDGLSVYSGPVVLQKMPQIFQRSTLQDLPNYDLAKRALDAGPTGLQRTGGLFR